MVQLSNDFPLYELIRSDTAARKGWHQEPSKRVVSNLKTLCEMCLQPIRDQFGVTVVISGWRWPELNSAVGGAKNSDHLFGRAADIRTPQHDLYEVANWAAASLVFDQLILENYNTGWGWIHISYHEGQNKGEVLTYRHKRYERGLII